MCFLASTGEDRFLTFDKKDVRTSRDWVDNRWVRVEAKPDILDYISAYISPSIKLSACSGDNATPQHEFVTSKLEAVKEEEEEGLVGSAVVEVMKQPRISDESGAGNEDKSAMTEDHESANPKCEAMEVQ